MKALLKLLLCVLTVLACSSHGLAAAPPPEQVKLQLKWFNQFQFAGYYAAIEQGYFAAEGLEVKIIERDLAKNFVKQVAAGEAEYGVGDSGLISQYAQGEPIVALAAIFQHNPLVFMSRQDSGIISPYEMAGKRVMSDIISTNEAPLRAMLAGTGLTEKDYRLIPQSNDYDLLTRGEIDVISGYLTDQPYFFKQQGLRINIINPQNYGVDFYGDILFTSRNELQKHPGRAERFRRAALKGWHYALEHPEELIQIIHSKYHSKLPVEHLRFEAAETRKLILHDVVPLGQIETRRMRTVADLYANAGFNRPLSDAKLSAFIFGESKSTLDLSAEEKAWLQAHPVIRIGIDRDFAPYEWIDEKGEYTGLAADYMRLLEKQLGVKFEIVKDKPWKEILEMAKRGDLDMLSCAVKTPERSTYLNFSEPYKATHAVIINNGQGSFLGSLNALDGKRVAVEKGYFMQELLKKNHPQIQVVSADNTAAALRLVVDGLADAYVGDAGSANFAIRKQGLLTLRFSGQTDYQSRHSVAVSKNLPLLDSAVKKAMAGIDKKEADEIFNRWLGLRVEQGVATATLVKYAAATGLLFLLFGYWVVRLRREVAQRLAAESYEQSRSQMLELIAQDAPLAEVLDAIARGTEATNPDMLCSILLLDAEGRHLQHGAAPSLPEFFNHAVHGLAIGEGVGSCGTAAHRGERIIVEDIATHPYWTPYAEVARKAGLGACWSEPIKNSAGKVLGTFGIYRRQASKPGPKDIELISKAGKLAGIAIERSQAAEQLRHSEARLRAIIANEPECIKIVDAKGELLEMNPAGLAMLEVDSLEQIAGQPVINLILPEHRKAYIEMHHKVLAGEPQQMEFEVQGLKGRHRWLETHAVPLLESSGNIVQLGVTRDITERKQTETAMQKARDAAEALARSKTEFLANMSHEIRTPMNGIIGLTHLALHQATQPAVRDYLQKIASSSASLLDILNDILDLSKLEAGRLEIHKQPFDLDILIANLRNLFEQRTAEKFLALEIDVPAEIPRHLVGDALRIQQILANLLGNAIKFTAQGHVRLTIAPVRMEASRATLRWTVEDTGIGIAEEDLAKLFQPFSQVDSSITRRFGGTGLGLAISHDLLQLMGEKFEVQSAPGKGSRFSFELSLDLAAAPDPAALPRDTTEDFTPLLKGKRILVVEDNTINQQVVSEFLALSGMTVSLADNGQQALQKLEEESFDAVLMDVHMPVMGGVEATRLIRAQPQLAALPVIALTAGVTQAERENCQACGMNDFIAKPVSPSTLQATLARWIGTPSTDTAPEPASAMPSAEPANLALPGFDLANLLTMLGGQQALAINLLRQFAEDVKDLEAKVRALIDAGDFGQAKETVHRCKGAAGNLGAVELHAAATRLDLELKQGFASPEALQSFELALTRCSATLADLPDTEK